MNTASWNALMAENKALKESRDELLHWLDAMSVWIKNKETFEAVGIIIRKAETQKEKENKL